MTVWAQDEGRIGLKPVSRRTWAPKGARPVAHQRPRYKWMYVNGFVRPDTGDLFWLFMPTVSIEVFEIALREFAKFTDAGPDNRVVLVLDRAGWHVSKKLTVPQGLHLLFLPAYSPQLQPVERLWPLLHEAIANRAFDHLHELRAALTERCNYLAAHNGLVKAVTGYHWWLDAVRPIV